MSDSLEAAVCWPCIVGLHEECYDPQLDELAGEIDDGQHWVTCCCSVSKVEDAKEFMGIGRPVSDPKDIGDITSTGRKRAAMLYPIMEGMLCEWSGLKFAGGGVEPIIGCDGHTLTADKGPTKGDRHHGPDKNTISNDPGNVHRICSSCHNRWHARNNEFYGPRPPADQQYLPVVPFELHDPKTLATDEERADNEEWWAKSKADRNVALDD